MAYIDLLLKHNYILDSYPTIILNDVNTTFI
jgi:hypothetical protein